MSATFCDFTECHVHLCLASAMDHNVLIQRLASSDMIFSFVLVLISVYFEVGH